MKIKLIKLIIITIAGSIPEDKRWNVAFGLAAIVMIISLINFIFTQRSLGTIGLQPGHPLAEVKSNPIAKWKEYSVYVGTVLLVPIIQIMVSKTEYTDYFMWTIGPLTLLYLFYEMSKVTPEERKKLWAALVFIKQSIAHLLLIVLFATGYISDFAKSEFPASWFQSVNPLAVIILAPIFSLIWGFLYVRKLEPSSPKKMAIGLGLVALGYVVIAIAVKGLGIGDKVSMNWLFALYIIHTCGELCLSPIGLSMVSKLAPLRLSSLMMGTWFLANAAANKFAGTLSALIPGGEDGTGGATSFLGFQITNLYEFFVLFIIMSGAAAAILFVLSSWLEKRMHNDHVEAKTE